ncbi:hypothetical protein [Maridesulfovibrio sp.]|jgi:hypothetical protein|uniref:hypothetical protein n=1 Tax=Maridesulfovibrio sp. TaxID=2795000 RepID=UPI0029CA7F29|nr:hypothetical protein [Maridesulfovibrio sp.]
MAVDQEFLYKTLRGFGDTGLPQQTVTMLIIVGFGIVAIAAAVLWYNNRELKKRLNATPTSWITGKKQLEKIFETALVYRSKIDLSFYAKSEKRRTIACSIEDIDGHLKLEIPSNGSIGKSWLGREVNGFFHIPSKQAGMVIFYNFNSVITEVKAKGSQYYNLTLDFPDHIEQTQKREFLRVSPPTRHYDYVNIIPDTKQGMAAGLKFISTNGEYTPGYMGGKDSNVILADISGGGLSLELTHMNSKRAARFKLNKGQNFLVMLSLVDFGNKGIVRHLFIAKIRRLFIDPAQSHAQLGLSFEFQFMGFDEETKKPKWEMVSQNGCPAMDDWTYNLYLELYREGNE